MVSWGFCPVAIGELMSSMLENRRGPMGKLYCGCEITASGVHEMGPGCVTQVSPITWKQLDREVVSAINYPICGRSYRAPVASVGVHFRELGEHLGHML